ncbi:MAG TPA: GNAT family N-acetyltransferase [Armatimonadota bacterium]
MTISEVPAGGFQAYADIPIAFTVRSILLARTVEGGLGGLLLTEMPVAPYQKDYDALESPLAWAACFDTSRWAVFAAHEDGRRIGGAVAAWNTPDVDMLEGRTGLAVLWDIRVHPDFRRRGAGHALFQAAAQWARERGCTAMDVETQNVNVPACRFYARQGCDLRIIRRFAYPTLPHEVQLIWRLRL